MKIRVNDIKATVKEILPAKGGVKIKVKIGNGKSVVLSNNKKREIVYSCKRCEDILLEFEECYY